MGLLDHKSRKIGDTEISVFVLQEWNQNRKEKLYETAFTLYKEAPLYLMQKVGGSTSLVLCPKRTKDLRFSQLKILFPGFSNESATPERWLLCAESLLNRWLIYPTFRMEYEDRDDFWLLDGIPAIMRSEYAIKLGFWMATHI